MALSPFNDPASNGEYVHFKPADHANAVAILVEPIRFSPNEDKPWGPQDTMYADITVFPNEAALTGQPLILKGADFAQTALVRVAKGYVGQAVAVTLKMVPTKGGKTAWTFQPLSPELAEKVEAYMENREDDGDNDAWPADDSPF